MREEVLPELLIQICLDAPVEPSVATPTPRRARARRGVELWKLLTFCWLDLGGVGLLSLGTSPPLTTVATAAAPVDAIQATNKADLELVLAGGMRHLPYTLEATTNFLNGFLQMVASFPFHFIIDKPREPCWHSWELRCWQSSGRSSSPASSALPS